MHTVLLRTAFAALGQLLVTRGAGPNWERSLYQRFVKLGLEEMGMEGHLVVRPGGTIGARLDRANFAQIREVAVSAGLTSAGTIDRMLTLLESPRYVCASTTMFTTWGRHP